MVTFSIIGDLHYSIGESESEEMMELKNRFFQHFLTEFFSLQSDFHVSIGDLTHHGKREEIQSIYAKINHLSASFQHVLGNHDLYELTKDEIVQLTGKPRYHAYSCSEGRVIRLDSTREKRPDNWSGVIDNEQFYWLKQEIDSHQNEPLIIFSHHPLYNTTTRSSEFNGSIIKEDPIHELLQNHKPGGYFFCGHCHTHSICREDNWCYIQTAAVYDHPVIRTVSIKNRTLKTTLHEIDDIELKNNAKKIHDSLYEKNTPFDPYGHFTDRSRKLVLI
ncbi:metallophosphoesterase [Geomicrobium sp. JSM 1781026]|uniref:metallophosphoesterase family protein n=1 Tax=Geomicrobium sp. JSM 1781026 TaxID=3344580 RepID=UPI0035C0C9F7